MILLACPACSRQYDVTHHDPGSRVRCVCDETFTVKHPKELRVRALVCKHCGGAVGPDDAACPYCSAALSAADRRESMLCPSCMTRIAEGSNHCRACGTPIAPQALTALPEGHSCPRCKGELGHRDLGQTSVVECLDCGGLWLTPDTFSGVCDRAATREASSWDGSGTSGAAAAPERKMEDVRYVPCPTCGELMNRRLFRHRGASSKVVIDVCRHHGVWLDAQELEQVVAFIQSGAHRRGGEQEPTIKKPVFDTRDISGRARPARTPVERAVRLVGDIVSDFFGGILN